MQTQLRALQNQVGFTAVEILVAVFLITVGLVALAGLFPVTTQSISASNQRTTAALLAEQDIESARDTLLTNWSALPIGTTTTTSNGYTRTTQVTTVGSPAVPNLKQVIVTVTYPNQAGVQLTTVVGN